MEKGIIVKLHSDFEPLYHFPDIRKMVCFAFLTTNPAIVMAGLTKT
jgi:hypothetical protein